MLTNNDILKFGFESRLLRRTITRRKDGIDYPVLAVEKFARAHEQEAIEKFTRAIERATYEAAIKACEKERNIFNEHAMFDEMWGAEKCIDVIGALMQEQPK